MGFMGQYRLPDRTRYYPVHVWWPTGFNFPTRDIGNRANIGLCLWLHIRGVFRHASDEHDNGRPGNLTRTSWGWRLFLSRITPHAPAIILQPARSRLKAQRKMTGHNTTSRT